MTEFSASPDVYTGHWGSHRVWPPGIVPVRISIGLPRFLPDITNSSAAINDLMPWGLFKIADREEFTRRFRHRLHVKGPDLIQQQFDYLLEAYTPRSLMLCCYENLHKPGEWCHRRTFARWWHDKTGQVIHDLQMVELGAGSEVPFLETPSDEPAIPDCTDAVEAREPPPAPLF